MRASVESIIPRFQERFEGRVHWPYLDILGLVTVGIGCQVEREEFMLLPWVDEATGERATSAAIECAWGAVRAAYQYERLGGGNPVFSALTTIRLQDAAIDWLCGSRHRVYDQKLLARFGGAWESAPASAQLATLSMAYAMGEGRLDKFPRFCAAFRAADWGACALECRMDDSRNPGLRPRNAADAALFAASADGGDPDAVAWP